MVVKIPRNKVEGPATCGSSQSLPTVAAEGNTATVETGTESHRGIRSVPRELRSNGGGGDKKRRNKRKRMEESPTAEAMTVSTTTTRDLSRCVTVFPDIDQANVLEIGAFNAILASFS